MLALGETREMSGEATSRSTLDLPGQQQELIDAIKATGKPFVVVLFNGRPLTLGDVAASSPGDPRGVVPGRRGRQRGGRRRCSARSTRAASCRSRSRSGSARCRSTTTTSRPAGRATSPQKYDSRYRDLRSCDPLYAFGFGLSYTTFSVSDLTLDRRTVSPPGSVRATVTVTNTGHVAGDDVVQLYLHDPVASISQPVRRLRGFERVTLQPGESRKVTFTLDRSDFGFYDNRGRFVVEPGQIELYAGDSSQATMKTTFTVTGR